MPKKTVSLKIPPFTFKIGSELSKEGPCAVVRLEYRGQTREKIIPMEQFLKETGLDFAVEIMPKWKGWLAPRSGLRSSKGKAPKTGGRKK